MIFSESTTINVGPVTESQYDLGITGALMHVYENECNYNTILKSAGISESKYYAETGGDLFVQEAGSLKKLGERFIAFFKKIIEKIKSIGKKFLAKINQYTMDDKKFVKKYQKDLILRDLKDMEFDGWEFPLTEPKVSQDANGLAEKVTAEMDTDKIEEIIEENRGTIVGGSSMDSAEFRDELKEKLYGDKDSIKVNINKELKIITDTSNLVKEAQKKEKDSVKLIENIIKNVNKGINEDMKKITDPTVGASKTKGIHCRTKRIDVWRAYSNDLTIAFGAYVKALTDRNRQAKAICVKALSYKHEAATMEGAYFDLFSDVEII